MDGPTLAVEHEYYCSDSNYYKNGCLIEYGDLAEFMDEWGDSDMDYNLVFRWDWIVDDPTEVADPDLVKNDGKTATFHVFVMGQRKGKYVPIEVRVTDEDMPAARAWLEPRWAHLRALWAPFS